MPAWTSELQLLADVIIRALVAAVGHGRFWSLLGKQPVPGYSFLVAGAIILAALPAMLPTAKNEYRVTAVPLASIAALEAWRSGPRSTAAWWLLAWSIAAWLAFIIVDSTLVERLRPFGSTTIVMLALVLAGLVVLRRQRQPGLPSSAPSVLAADEAR